MLLAVLFMFSKPVWTMLISFILLFTRDCRMKEVKDANREKAVMMIQATKTMISRSRVRVGGARF